MAITGGTGRPGSFAYLTQGPISSRDFTAVDQDMVWQTSFASNTLDDDLTNVTLIHGHIYEFDLAMRGTAFNADGDDITLAIVDSLTNTPITPGIPVLLRPLTSPTQESNKDAEVVVIDLTAAQVPVDVKVRTINFGSGGTISVTGSWLIKALS